MDIQLPHWWSLFLCEASEALNRACVGRCHLNDGSHWQPGSAPTPFFGETTGVVPIFGHESSEWPEKTSSH